MSASAKNRSPFDCAQGEWFFPEALRTLYWTRMRNLRLPAG